MWQRPRDNAYIKALHSNLQREVIERFEFDSIYHAQMIIDRYYKWYNEKKKARALNGRTPDFIYSNILIRFPLITKNYSTTFE